MIVPYKADGMHIIDMGWILVLFWTTFRKIPVLFHTEVYVGIQLRSETRQHTEAFLAVGSGTIALLEASIVDPPYQIQRDNSHRNSVEMIDWGISAKRL